MTYTIPFGRIHSNDRQSRLIAKNLVADLVDISFTNMSWFEFAENLLRDSLVPCQDEVLEEAKALVLKGFTIFGSQ